MTPADSPASTVLPSTPPRQRVFPAHPQQVAAARAFLTAILHGCPAADDAILCMSELASNAIIHSASRGPAGTFTVTVQRSAGCLRVEVRDQGGPWNQPIRSRNGQRGRGLLIVGQLTRAWGRTGDAGTGWQVWFEMECP